MKKQESKTTAGLLPLHVDIVFKIFCIKYPHLLSDLLNAVLGFEGSNKIEELQILNPEIPGDIATDKVSILDIYATNKQGKHFGVEMQAFPQSYYGKRVLYYWSKLYSQQIDRGNLYSILQPVYSVSFLNFDLLKIENFHSTFLLLEKNNPEITLTKDLEIHIIELRKFLKLAGELKTNLEDWIYLLRQSGSLKENEVNELKVKNPIIQQAIEALQDISLDKKTRDYYEMRIKSERDFHAMRDYAYNEGLEKGIEKGIEKGKRLIEIRERKAKHKEKLKTAIKMKRAGSSLDFISEMTELPKVYLETFFRKALRG